MKRLSMPALPALELALLGLTLSAIALAVALRHALRPSTAQTIATETITLPSTRRASDGVARSSDVALADDPFFPSRTPPATRYPLTGASASVAAAAQNDPHPPVVLGTVVGADGSSFAICRMNNEPPRSVRVGGTIAGYRLTAVERSRAVFVTPDGRSWAVASSTSSRPTTVKPPQAGQPHNPPAPPSKSGADAPDDQDQD